MTSVRLPRSLAITVATTLVAATGCATIRSGEYGVPVDATSRPLPATAGAPLRVSAGELASVSSPYFGLVEVTFENDSPAWVQIDRVDLDFGSPDRNRSVQVPWGDDLIVWNDAIEVRNAVRAVNDAAALSTVALLASIGWAAGGGHRHATAPAAAAMGGVVAVGALGALSQGAEAASTGPRFAGTHLLAMPIRVPPGLFTKRWILFYTAARPLGGCIDRMVLSYQLADQRQGRIALHYKLPWSEWMRESCSPQPAPYKSH